MLSVSVRGSQTAAPADEQKKKTTKDKNDGRAKPESASLCMQKFRKQHIKLIILKVSYLTISAAG